tara:strand:- start:372 stop:527 length:156 start_codon:yes stop_codon:yes gene_type:complete
VAVAGKGGLFGFKDDSLGQAGDGYVDKEVGLSMTEHDGATWQWSQEMRGRL